MKDIKLKFIAISCILLILFMPVYTARVFAQDEQNENNEIIVDNTPPSINIEKPPEKVTEPFLDIKGTTNEPVVIEVTLNSNYYGTASSTEDNIISIGMTLAEGENKIVINSTDAGGNSVINKFDVFCDSEPPQIIYHNLYELSPAYTAKQTVKGQVNKPDINIDVFVNDKNKYSGKSDSDGNFEIKINLDKSIKIGVTYKSITVGTQEGNAWENKIKIVATDDYGREATVEDVIIYTLCGYGSDWDVKTDKITPDVIIPEHLIQGIAQFSFPINLTYRGRSDPSEVALTSEPQLTSYELSSSSMEKFQDELFPGSAMGYWDDDYTHGYFIVNLNPWPYTKEELNNLSFIKIPLRLDIYYEYEDMNGDIVENTQRNCWTISIMVDKEIPLDKIPKELLNATINLLNSTINLIDGIKKPVDIVKKYTFIGCLGSWLVHLFKSASVEFSCVSVKEEAKKALINGDDTCSKPSEQDESGKLIEFDCDSCLQSLKSLREFEKTRNWICDRIFCPSVPSLDYHKESYKDSITDVNLCKGIPGIEESFEGKSSEECEEEYKRAWDSAFMTLDEWERASTTEEEREESFFDKISEGLAFCEKVKEQEVTIVTVGSGSKQEVYLVYPDGSVCIGEPSKVEKGSETPEGTISVGEGDSQSFYRCNEEDFLPLNEEGYYIYTFFDYKYYTHKNGSKFRYNETVKKENIKKIPSDVQSKRGIEGKNNYILDPTSDFIRSVQAVCLPAVSGWLNLWKQILEAVKQCFETIMITGQGSAGVCKAVLTTYVCDIIYDVIRCTGESFAFGAGEEISGGLVGVMQKISTAGKNVADSVSSRYGQTGMYNTMFNERKIIHSVCLVAFTGDWGEFDLDTILSAEVGMPTLGSEGFLYPTTRRFMGSNPLDYGRTTYIYHIGAGIIAGADLNYKVYLQCSNDNSCPEGRCDCFYRGKEEIYNVDSGSLSAGDLYSDEFYIDTPDFSVRYDKAVIEWDWIDNNNQLQTTTKVSEIKDMGEKAPSDCKLDSASGEFRCSYIIGKYGEARFVSIEPSDEKQIKKGAVKELYSIGETINFDLEIEIKKPESGYQIPKYLIWRLTDTNNKEIGREEIRIPKGDGIWGDTLPGFKIEDVFGTESKDTIDVEVLKGYENKLDVNKELIGEPKEDLTFAIIFAEEKFYKIYSVSKKGEDWTIGKYIDKPPYDSNARIIEYKDKGIKFELNSNPDIKKGEYAAVIIVKKAQKIEGCVDGEAKWKIRFELLHSKKKPNYEGTSPADYECCGSSIEKEDIGITIDCGREAHDEEKPCETNKLINEECDCSGKPCGNVQDLNEWNICCGNGLCIKNNQIDKEEIDGTKIDISYVENLCENLKNEIEEPDSNNGIH